MLGLIVRIIFETMIVDDSEIHNSVEVNPASYEGSDSDDIDIKGVSNFDDGHIRPKAYSENQGSVEGMK